MSDITFYHTKKNPLVIPVLIAQEKGFFQKRGIEVDLNLAEDFVFNGNEAFRLGKSDAMIGDLTFFFYMLEQGKEAVITSNLTRTIHLVARKGLQPPYDSIKVGVNRKGLFRLFLENDLKTVVPNAEIVWIDNSYERMLALNNGTIDALVAIEPFVGDLLDEGHYSIWSMKDSDKNMVMWAFDARFYQQNKAKVEKFHEAIEEGIKYFNQHKPEEKIKLCLELGYPEVFAEKMKSFIFASQQKIKVEDFNLCQEWMYRTGEIKKQYDADLLIK